MTPDPMRTLDDATPPDLWDDITTRAAEREAPVARDRRHRPVLLSAAAAIVVVAAVAGGFVLADRGGEPDQASDPAVDTADTMPTDSDPRQIWDRRWELTRLEVDGEDVPIPEGGAAFPGSGPYTYFLRATDGTVGFDGCNSGRAPAELVGDRLHVEREEYAETLAGCSDELLMIDSEVVGLLLDDPVVTVTGAELTLWSGDTFAEFVDLVYEAPTPEDLAGIWGREWDLVELVVEGRMSAVPPVGTGTDGARPVGSPVYLDLTTEGRVLFTGCNGGGTQAELVDGHLVAITGWDSTAADCSDDGGGDFGGFGDDLAALDETMAELILADPEVVLDGNQLTLTVGDTSARFFAADARPRMPDIGTVLLPSGDSPCALDVSDAPAGEWDVGAGAFQNLPANRPVPDTSGLWTVIDDEGQIALIEVPGQPVIDLVGERTEEVVLDEWGPATIWYRRGEVEVRVFPGLADAGPCDSFTVTVAGPERSARDFALEVANAVVTAER